MKGRKEQQRRRQAGKVNDQVEANGRSYSETVIEGALRTERVFTDDSVLRKTDKLGHGQGGSILVHVGTNNAEGEDD